MTKEIEEIGKIIDAAEKRFKMWLEKYSPWVGYNHTTERNLSFQFATAFLDIYKEGIVFMEVPFSTIEGGRNVNHLDAYLCSENFDILLECKNIYAPTHIKTITADITRMDNNLIKQIHSRNMNKPKMTYGVIFAETWYKQVADWWEGKYKGPKSKWENCELVNLETWNFKSRKIHVHNGNPDRTLFWMYGVSVLKN